jgi:hypothetical protein
MHIFLKTSNHLTLLIIANDIQMVVTLCDLGNNNKEKSLYVFSINMNFPPQVFSILGWICRCRICRYGRPTEFYGFFFFLWWDWGLNSRICIAKQVLYCWSHTSSPHFALVILEMGVAELFARAGLESQSS